MGKTHVIVIPYPAQGHVIPMMELAQLLVSNGVKVTFVNSEINHHRILKSLCESDSDNIQKPADMAFITDGMEPWEDRKDLTKLTEITWRVMPGELKGLIERINGSQEDKITCMVADWSVGWALEVAEKLGLRRAAFWPATAAALAAVFSIPNLISDGFIDSEGRALTDQAIQLLPTMPKMKAANLIWWRFYNDETTRKIIFDIMVKDSHLGILAEQLICNSSPELEPAAFSQFPNITPIGPVLASSRLGKVVGHFWAEDSACVAWLDQQVPNSVIYVAFGSFTVFDQTQFEELALGLELTNRPFLWVVRQDDTTVDTILYPTGFKERVESRGRMVGWAPQQQVLSHPSVAIFISHCGWNSTIEGVANGVPFLCWPYFGDQILNQAYICDEWEIGLGFSKDENGIIRKEEIKDKVEHLLTDKSYKDRALNLQAKTMADVGEGCCHKNFSGFIEWIKNN